MMMMKVMMMMTVRVMIRMKTVMITIIVPLRCQPCLTQKLKCADDDKDDDSDDNNHLSIRCITNSAP